MLAKHPVHIMLVHFPSALLPVDLIFQVMAHVRGDHTLAVAAYYCLMGGVIGGWIAVLSGMTDLFLYLTKEGDKAIKTGLTHAWIQTGVVTGFTAILAFEYKTFSNVLHLPLGLAIAKGILLLVMFAGNYLGGELLFNHVIKQIKK
ncbi:MAG: DUF2231 domain-containing protein [Bacteroidota bacterium]